jgi:hypothetical protein
LFLPGTVTAAGNMAEAWLRSKSRPDAAYSKRNWSIPRLEPNSSHHVVEAGKHFQGQGERKMPAILMWLIGIPIPIIILLYLIT